MSVRFRAPNLSSHGTAMGRVLSLAVAGAAAAMGPDSGHRQDWSAEFKSRCCARTLTFDLYVPRTVESKRGRFVERMKKCVD